MKTLTLAEQEPPGLTAEAWSPPTRPDPDDPDRDRAALNAIITILHDREHSLFRLCDITGLSLHRLADLLESEEADRALNAMERCLRVRERAVDIHKRFISESALLRLAQSTPLTHREAEPVRKAATTLAVPPKTKPKPKPPAPEPPTQAAPASLQAAPEPIQAAPVRKRSPAPPQTALPAQPPSPAAALTALAGAPVPHATLCARARTAPPHREPNPFTPPAPS